MSLKNEVKKTVLIASGASGGHIFPALAVAQNLKKEGFRCIFVGNQSPYFDRVKAEGFEVDVLPSSPWNVRNPLRKLKSLFVLCASVKRAIHLVRHYRPSVVFGTGGYATVSLVFAAKVMSLPTLIAEQNVLPGRANRLLSRWVDRVCLTFESSRHYLKYREGAIVTTGNPVRAEIVAAAESGKGLKEKKDHQTVLVFGGSQGARILSDVVPAGIAQLPENMRKRLRVVQQARPEDKARVVAAYEKLGIDAQVETFFNSMETLWGDADVIIGRSGASTLCEAFLFGVAAVYVPILLADSHQVLNAKVAERKGAGVCIDQADFTPEKLAETLEDILLDETRLKQMQAAAYAQAQPNAAQRIAAEVIKLSEKDVIYFEGATIK